VHDAQGDTQLVLVLFDEVEDTMSADVTVPGDDGRDPRVVQLEEELRRTRQQLQHTIEQSETSTEELKASNEELRSMNEELITVNHELKAKVDETAKINDDLQNLIASTDIATVFVDRGLSIKRYTPRATQLFSIIPGDVGRPLLDITHRLDYPQLADDAAEVFRSLRVIEREVSGSDGRWYLARVLPYRTVEDRIDGAVLTFVDISRRRDAEARQRATEERMRLVVESTRDYAIVTLDTEGRITSWNKAAERIFGYSEVEAAGQPVALLFTPEDRAKGAPEAELQRARDEGRAEDNRWHLRKDGSSFFCSGITTPLHEAGVLKGYAKIARDLTGSKRAEDERERLLRRESAARAEALAASHMKDEFLAVMSHELKNPLNLIQLHAELLLRLPQARETPELARAAMTISKGVESQAQIIDDLLDLSRVNTGKLALVPAEVDWSHIVRSIASAVAQDATAKSIRLELDIADGVMLRADPVRIEQVVWNLLWNALKFTPKGGNVSLRLAPEGEFGVLRVCDSGRGIELEFLPKVFEMFQQADSRPTRSGGGLGIGLALVRHIVVLHGGSVEAASEGAGRGACFTVRLPLRGSASAAAVGTRIERPLPAGLHALIVDDETQTLEMLSQLLALDGVQVTTASNGVEALAAAEREKFDVIVSDIAMPKMNGYQLVEALRQSPALAATPMIALTGFGRPADAKRAIAAGYDLHLAKPVTLQRLTDALLAVLRNSEG
jgi:two-component system, chemotaxis family, CheB/CheR fusion protein